MKEKLLLLPFLLLATMASAQVEFFCEDQRITIDATKPIDFEHEIDFATCRTDKTSKSKIIFKCEITLPDDYSLSIKKNSYKQPTLEITPTKKNLNQKTHVVDLTFQRNTEYEITITSEGIKKVYKIRTKTDWSWTTTFGANAIFFSNRNKYISHKNEDDTYSVAEIQDRKQMEVLPVVMFTFLKTSNRNLAGGFTGGLGINFEEIALFAGGSLGVGQNIMITGGVAVHKQVRPHSNYFVGQIIESSITSDNLNESQYRFNPFIGISFRLNNNPFAKKSE